MGGGGGTQNQDKLMDSKTLYIDWKKFVKLLVVYGVKTAAYDKEKITAQYTSEET